MLLHQLNNNKTRRTPQLSYLVLLTLFLLLLVIGPLLPSYYRTLFANITFSSIILSSVFTLSLKRSLFFTVIMVAVLSVLLNSITLIKHPFWIEFSHIIITLSLVGTVIVTLFKHVFLTKAKEVDLIFGSICIYLLLGVLWALIYSLINLLAPDAFHGVAATLAAQLDGHPSNQSCDLQPFLYYSFVTQTTLGYGDITPTIPIAENLAVIQAIMGQFYLAVLVAGLVGTLFKGNQQKLES